MISYIVLEPFQDRHQIELVAVSSDNPNQLVDKLAMQDDTRPNDDLYSLGTAATKHLGHLRLGTDSPLYSDLSIPSSTNSTPQLSRRATSHSAAGHVTLTTSPDTGPLMGVEPCSGSSSEIVSPMLPEITVQTEVPPCDKNLSPHSRTFSPPNKEVVRNCI